MNFLKGLIGHSITYKFEGKGLQKDISKILTFKFMGGKRPITILKTEVEVAL